MGLTYNVWRKFQLAASEALPRWPGGAKPIAGRVGWRGLPLHTNNGADSGFRRTASLHPRLRVSAGLRFAVILLSKTVDIGRDHLIHRKRSPFPYEGKALTPLKVGETARSSAHEDDFARLPAKRQRFARRDLGRTAPLRGA